LADLGRTVATHEAAISRRADIGDQHRGLGDRPITVENDATVRALLAVRHGGVIDHFSMVPRRPVCEFDRRRDVNELGRIPGVGEACTGESNESVQPIDR
jgi:hypothetical protein